MRARRTVSLIVSAALIGALMLAAVNASAATSKKQVTLRYLFKTTSESLTTPSGKTVSSNQALAPGDLLFATDNMYKGTKAHHASRSKATAFLYCTITKVTKSAADAKCDAVVAIRGSMLISQSTQNLYARSTVYPIVDGTGKYLHATGDVKVRDVNKSGSEAEGIFTIK